MGTDKKKPGLAKDCCWGLVTLAISVAAVHSSGTVIDTKRVMLVGEGYRRSLTLVDSAVEVI
jgi:hypothetical protein